MATIRSRGASIALLVSILVLITGGGVAVASHAFTDVPDDAYYHEATAFMKDTGITSGCTPTEYCPGNPLTRGQMAQFLWRVSGYGDVEPMVNADKVDGVDATELASGAGWAVVESSGVNFEGAPVVLATVDIVAPTNGVAVVRFDGQAIVDVGDRLVLAASHDADWHINSGNVSVEAVSADLDTDSFSHTRAYEVPAGTHTFYAVGENYVETDGSGVASVYGQLTVEFFPQHL